MSWPEKTYTIEFRVALRVSYKASVAEVGQLLGQELGDLNLDDHIACVEEINSHGEPSPLLLTQPETPTLVPEASAVEPVKHEFRGLTCPTHGLVSHSRPRRAAVRDRASANVSEKPKPWLCTLCTKER